MLGVFRDPVGPICGVFRHITINLWGRVAKTQVALPGLSILVPRAFLDIRTYLFALEFYGIQILEI